VTDAAILSLQDLAFRSAKTGLKCEAELAGTCPTWKAWILASAKRRTVLTMFLFISIYRSESGLSNFLFEELGDIVAPESKALWEAVNAEIWTSEYREHLVEWGGAGITISELFNPRQHSEGVVERRRRWVESKDGFGTMLFSVFAHVYGCS
jgi:hypothetical protein